MDKRFVLVSGLPGSGKTTMARGIAPLLGLPLIDKDDILDRLFNEKGIGDADWRRGLSRESDALLRAEAVRSAGAVLSSFWWIPGMPPDSGTPVSWLFELSALIVTVRCACPPEIAAERFARRSRHPGHLDSLRSYAEVLASIRALPDTAPPNLGEVIDIDTSGSVPVKAVAREITCAFARCETSIYGRPAVE